MLSSSALKFKMKYAQYNPKLHKVPKVYNDKRILFNLQVKLLATGEHFTVLNKLLNLKALSS